MALPAVVSRKLSQIVEREIGAYREYLEILREQRKTIAKFDTEFLKRLDKRRRELTVKLKEFHEARVEMLKDPAFLGEMRLTTVLERFGSEEEKKTLLPKIEELRRLAELARKEASEAHAVQGFALNVVNGSLSLLMRATKHVSKQYGRQGKINESYLPRSDRHEGVLKEA
ncbi:MAG: flagellar export chaperone FlgN [Bdellovibrionales bacterium]|nr:flagellar export chaperone FlgN [Bdellovibrionales bacterium]